MRRCLPLAFIAAACSGTDPSDLSTVEPGLYVLSSFDGGPAPADVEIADYPDRREVFALFYDSVWIESAETFRRHYETRAMSITKAVPAETTLFESRSLSYPGRIYAREGGLVLDDGDPFFDHPILKFELVEDRLIHRLRLGESTCTGTPPESVSCQVVRDVILGAEYVRR